MNNEEPTIPMSADEQALDAGLAQVLRAPPLPTGFRGQLNAALIRADATENIERRRLENERREWLAKFEVDYLRLRRRTLGTLIGGAFAAGVAVALALPWFNATFGIHGLFALATSGAVIGVTIGTVSWVRHLGLQNPIDLF